MNSPPSPEEAELDELIIRSLQGRITADEAVLLNAWRASSAENEARFRAVEQLWRITASAATPRRRPVPTAAELTGEASSASPAVVSGASAIGKLRARRALRAGLLRRRSTGIAAAAAVALLAFAAVFGVLRNPNPRSSAEAFELVTGAGEMASAYLPDGTVVRLGPDSRLTSTSGSSARDAWLEGSAFFAVAHDAARPFVVRSPAGIVRVLGTRFRMTSHGEDIDLTVVEGTVAVAAGSDELVIRAGESVEMRSGRAAPVVGPADLAASFRWLGGFIAFQSTPLRDAAAELEARFGRQIRFADAAAAEITVTAWFTDAAYDDVVAVLCRIASVRCSERDGVTWIEQ